MNEENGRHNENPFDKEDDTGAWFYISIACLLVLIAAILTI